MPHEVIASLAVPLPDDPQQMAESLSFIAKTWGEMLATLSNVSHQPSGQLKPQAQLNVHEVRAKAKGNSGQGGRKTRERTTTTTSQEAPSGDP